MKRRDFLLAAAGVAAPRSSVDFSQLPNFCSHEHWGSIDSIGTFPGGYRADIEPGAVPGRRTGFMDLLLDPYFRGWLRSGGTDLTKISPSAEPGWESFKLLRQAIEDQRFTGAYQCIRRGILQLYGIDLDKLNRQTAGQLDSMIAKRYQDPFRWYKTAMQRAHFSELIRIVHPEFYVSDVNPETAAEEKAFTHTLMRIDLFTAFQEQLGLKLNSTKALVEVVVIDKVSRPSEN
jgi:hypothetical protein